ncbi:Fe3+-citrate ABC transporter substrate-binding protein, partial [Vibrio anguillarum]|nr:Fe3+-citrate ABC transporter substrate-binding protein [Vibrio anguillarum]
MTKQSNYETNTGHRFISESDNCFKLHIHCPDDTV